MGKEQHGYYEELRSWSKFDTILAVFLCGFLLAYPLVGHNQSHIKTVKYVELTMSCCVRTWSKLHRAAVLDRGKP